MGRPNLFKWATSELSQDALLCWLVEWAAQKEDSALKRCGLDLIGELFKAGLRKGADPNTITNVRGIGQQEGKVDVCFKATVSGEEYQFIIEDKVNTGAHSNQLKRYKAFFMDEEGIKEDNLVCVYFKLNELTEDQYDAALS